MSSTPAVKVSITADASSLKTAVAQAQQQLAGMGSSAGAAGRSAKQGMDVAAAASQEAGKSAARAARDVASAGNEAERALSKMASMGHLGVAWLGFSQLQQAATAAARAIWDAGVQAQRTRALLEFATGGNSAQALREVAQTADRLGLSLIETAASYGRFAAAARGTRLEGAGAKQVFDAVAEAAAVMGLSAADTSGVLLALQQMVSKGTVSAEELRGQLGERLPGAFQIAARAMGVTTAELGKMLEQGQLVADDFLPRFGAQLHKELGGAAEAASKRLEASLSRLDNAWERLKQQMADSGASQGAAAGMDHLTASLKVASEAMDEYKGADKPLENIARGVSVAAGAFLGLGQVASSAFGSVEQRTAEAKQRLEQLTAEADALAAKGVRIPYQDEAIRRARQDLEYLLQLKARLEGGGDIKVGSQADVRKFDAKLQAEAEQRLATARAGVAAATQQASGVNQEYIKGLAAINQLMAEDPNYDPKSDATLLATKYGKPLVDAAKAGASEASQIAKAQADERIAIEKAASDERLRAIQQGMAEAARLRDQDILSGQQWAEQQVALLRKVQAEQLAQNAREQAAVASQRPKDAAEAARQRQELAKLRGDAKRITADAIASENKAIEDGYKEAAQAFVQAAGNLRQTVDQVQAQLANSADSAAQFAIGRIADPVAQAAARAAYEVKRTRQETERQIALLERRIAEFRAAGGDNGLDIGNAEAAIAGLRSNQGTTESAIQLNLEDSTRPQFQKLLTDWQDTTRLMREAWDTSISQMTEGAADAFGRFVSGQQVSLQQLAQQMLYTLGKATAQNLMGQAAGALGIGSAKGKSGDSTAALGKSAGDLTGSAKDITDSAHDSSFSLGSAAQQIFQSVLGWALPQAAQTTAGATLSGAAMALTGAATALTSAAAMLSAGSASDSMGSIIGAAAAFAAKGGTYAATPFASGGAFGSPAVATTRASPFSRGGEILSGPVAFRFREGAKLRNGIAGEAGPEAALPLKRGAGGALGVLVHGAAGRAVLPLSRGSGGILGVSASAVRSVALGREPRAARRDAVRARGGVQLFALGGVFGGGGGGGADTPLAGMGQSIVRAASVQASLALRPQVQIDMPAQINVDARSDQAQVAQMVATAMAAQEKRLWARLRERGVL